MAGPGRAGEMYTLRLKTLPAHEDTARSPSRGRPQNAMRLIRRLVDLAGAHKRGVTYRDAVRLGYGRAGWSF
jgi:hypothetical protein